MPRLRRGACWIFLVASAAAAGDGSWRNEYPPWEEPGSAMYGAPEFFVPILGAFLSTDPRGCMPTHYVIMRLAASHLNRRDATYCPAIAQLNNSFEVRYDFWDTNGTGTGVVVQAIDALQNDSKQDFEFGSKEARVKVFLGPNSDDEAVALHPFLGGAFSMPYLSWSADAEVLSNKAIFGYFFRISSSQLFAMRLAVDLLHWLNYTRVNCVFDDTESRGVKSSEVFALFRALALELKLEQVQGFEIDDGIALGTNFTKMQQVKAELLPQIEHTKVRVCVNILLNMRQMAVLFGLAHQANMMTGNGWLWFGTEAIFAWGVLTTPADIALYESTFGMSLEAIIRGVIFVVEQRAFPNWEDLQSAIQANISDLQQPEFSQTPKCGPTGGITCDQSPLFMPFNLQGCQFSGENPLFPAWAYNSMVALAVVTDRLMSQNPGAVPRNFTKADYTAGLRDLKSNPFDCLTGTMQFYEDEQQPAPTMLFVQFQQLNTVPTNPTVVIQWTQDTGFLWETSSSIQWADGTNVTPSARTRNGVSSTQLPSGMPPICSEPQQVWNNVQQTCMNCRDTESAIANDFGAFLCTCRVGNELYDPNDVLLGCKACPAGSYKNSAGSGACSKCDPGKVAVREGSETCETCEKGTYSSEDRTACVACPVEKTTEFGGTEDILGCICGDGYYGFPANGTCRRCPQGITSRETRNFYQQDCLCQKGYYRPKASPEECRACKDGMYCENIIEESSRTFGSIERGAPLPESHNFSGINLEPKLQEFHWAGDDDTLLVYRCSSRERCPGGGTAGNACGTTRLQGRACSVCPDDWYFDGRECTECSWLQSSFLVYPILPLLVGPGIVVFIYVANLGSQTKWNSPKNGCAALLFLTVSHYQSVYILSAADVEFTEVTIKFLELFSFANDMTTVFNLECRGGRSVSGKLLVKALLPGIVAIVFFGTWLMSKLVARVSKRWWLEMEQDKTINAFFTTVLLFFAGIVDMATVLFKCGLNTADNHTRTLMLDRGMICYRDTWLQLLAVGAIAVLLWVVGLGSLFINAVLTAPTWWGEHGRAEARWKFLFVKFRMDVHWWSLTFLVKGMLQNLVFVVFNSGLTQVYGIVGIAMTYSFGVIVFMPWRHMLVNYVDIAYHQCLMQLCAVIFWYVDKAEIMNHLMMVFATLGVPPAFFIIAMMLWQRFSDRARTEKGLMMMRVRTAFLEVKPENEDLDHFINTLSDWDFISLRVGMQVLVTELFGLRMRSGLMVKRPSQKRVTTLRNLRNFGGFEEDDDYIHDTIKTTVAAKSLSFVSIEEAENPRTIARMGTKHGPLEQMPEDMEPSGSQAQSSPRHLGDTVFLSA